MRGSREYCKRGSIIDHIFFLVEEIEDPNTAINGHHQPASKMPFKWRFAGGLIKAQH